MGGHIIQNWYECSIDDQNHDRYRIEFFDRSLRMKIFMVEIIDWLMRTTIAILSKQSLWSKERSVMSSEDLKDRKEEVSIGNPECQMQRLKLSILANNSIIAIVISIIKIEYSYHFWMIWPPILFNTYTISDSGILSSLIGLICNWLTFPLKVLIFGFPVHLYSWYYRWCNVHNFFRGWAVRYTAISMQVNEKRNSPGRSRKALGWGGRRVAWRH